MGYDFYQILGVKRNCTQLEIQKAYRRIAIKYNPERYGNSSASMESFFALICEAYDVLVDFKRRAVFDQYGEEGLKMGVPAPDNNIQPYTYHGEPLRTFREFFGTSNPYANLLDYYENPQEIFDSKFGKGYKKKDPTITRPLVLTLEEVYVGGLKKMKIQRLVFTDKKCTELKLREKVLSIPIKRGIYQNTEVIFKEEGDQRPSRIPADVVFITEDRPHALYVRSGKSNLLNVQSITLKQALCGLTINLDTLDGRKLHIKIEDSITPTYEYIVDDEGLPLPGCPQKGKGKLIIKFTIQYPKNLGKKAIKMFEEAFEINDLEQNEYNKLKCGILPA